MNQSKKTLVAFILLTAPPFEFQSDGRTYRLQIETESVSKEWRLFAKDIVEEKAGNYSARLMANAASGASLNSLLFTTGLEYDHGAVRFRNLTDLVREKKAAVVPNSVA